MAVCEWNSFHFMIMRHKAAWFAIVGHDLNIVVVDHASE